MRRSEKVIVGYFVYATAVGLARPIAPSIQLTACAVNLAIVSAYLFLGWADRYQRSTFISVLRDWAPLPFMLLGYREMGWFALPHPNSNLEHGWIVWDRLLLNDWGLRALIEAGGPMGPTVLEIAYMLVYAMGPICLGVLYLTGNRDNVDRFLFMFLLGVLSSDALFPYFPSEPPRAIFPGEDLPSVVTIFRRFNLWYLGGLGIHMSVFPSAHVSGSFSAAFGLISLVSRPVWIGRAMFVLAVLIAIATVYGRYHYAVDAAAGFVVAISSLLVTRLVYGSNGKVRG